MTPYDTTSHAADIYTRAVAPYLATGCNPLGPAVLAACALDAADVFAAELHRRELARAHGPMPVEMADDVEGAPA